MEQQEKIYFTHEHEKGIEKATRIAKELCFEVTVSRNDRMYNILFSKSSPCGQDFNVEINVDGITDNILESISTGVHESYENYDASYEAYLWLDDTGHGINGAPYEMGAVYDDMKACEGYILELDDALANVSSPCMTLDTIDYGCVTLEECYDTDTDTNGESHIAVIDDEGNTIAEIRGMDIEDVSEDDIAENLIRG